MAGGIGDRDTENHAPSLCCRHHARGEGLQWAIRHDHVRQHDWIGETSGPKTLYHWTRHGATHLAIDGDRNDKVTLHYTVFKLGEDVGELKPFFRPGLAIYVTWH